MKLRKTSRIGERLKGITKEVLERWFEETKINKPAHELSFGQYKICLDEGVILMKNTAKGQIDIISNLKIGLKNGISKNGKLVLSEIREKTKESGNAGFFAIDSGYEKAVYVSITYSSEEVQMRTTDYNLGFALSENFDASACEGTIIVIDREAQRYRLAKADGNTLSANLPLKPGALCFMVSRDVGIITDVDSVYVIHEAMRDLIDISKLNEKNGSILSEPEIGVGFSEDEHWLALKDKMWKKECLLVALGEREKFGHAFCSLKHPFESEDGSEDILKD